MGKVISVTTRTEQPHWVGSFVTKIANFVPRLSLLPTLSRLRGRGDPGNEKKKSLPHYRANMYSVHEFYNTDCTTKAQYFLFIFKSLQ